MGYRDVKADLAATRRTVSYQNQQQSTSSRVCGKSQSRRLWKLKCRLPAAFSIGRLGGRNWRIYEVFPGAGCY